MPKKEKTNKKSKSKKEEKEKSEKKKEKVQEIIQEEKSLEEKVEDSEEEINDEEFQDFFQEPEFQDFSPSLGRINAPQRGFVRLEQNLSESSSVNENNSDKGDPFKYNAIAGNKEQPKYMSYENQLTSNLMQVPEIEKFERKASWERTEILFQNSPDAKSSSENTFEKYNPVKKFDQKEFQKEDILSRKEIKYSPTKP